MAEQIPIVLHHGFMDVINFHVGRLDFHSFQGIDSALAGAGHPILRTRVHPTGSIERRATAMKQQILAGLKNREPGTKVLIIAHSMGGLDARYMISRLGMADRVAGLLTVSTPHRGSPYADYMLRNMNRIQAMRLFKMLHVDMDGVVDLSSESTARFNERTPDAKGVGYFSVSAECSAKQCPAWGRQSHRIIEEVDGLNDGLVSVRSARYANHLGTWHADHWMLLNKSFGRRAGDDIIDHYRSMVGEIVGQLAK